MIKQLIPLTVAAGVLIAASASARPPAASLADRRFAQLDRNGDGLLSSAELHPSIYTAVKRADVNGDGTISGEEIQLTAKLFHEQRIRNALRRLDVNGNGRVDDGEGLGQRRFRRLDHNRDGAVSPQELGAHAKRPTTLGIFAKLDRNGDGQIDRHEAVAPGARALASDTNGDGYLSREEFRAGYRVRKSLVSPPPRKEKGAGTPR